ncbi:MAG: aminoacyl-tRNA hydrolase, partial [Hyphococcus sp.]
MIVLVGLGNPGEKYAQHRHNVGFMAVDAIADAHAFGAPREKFEASIREGFLDGPQAREKALILKPMTYMNESGRAVQKAAQFYKLVPG